MRPPRRPPSVDDLIRRTPDRRIAEILLAAHSSSVRSDYLHWDGLIRRTPPGGLTHEEWWLALKLSRKTLLRVIPLRDLSRRPFQFVVTDPVLEQFHHFDRSRGDGSDAPELLLPPEVRERYSVSSMIEEAISSSRLEGATTTREVAEEMIRSTRAPRDRSEQMILNNFRAMQQIGKLKEQPLTQAVVFELHRIVTEETLEDPTAAGRFRQEGEPIIVGDEYGEVFYRPPAAAELEPRMATMCDFANGHTPDTFVHPVLRSILLHFWLAYDHPFVDGNGRTARALFYWSMLRRGYWLWEYVSISRILSQAPAQYGQAFLYTETDDNDLTYFIHYHIDVMRRALNDLHVALERKSAQIQALEQHLRGLLLFNPRQRALISHALRHPHQRYTIEGHRLSHNVVYQTARTDLLDLAERGILEARKVGKAWYFTPASAIEAKLQDLA